MDVLIDNLKWLRNKEGMTQEQFAEFLGIKRSLLGAYEEGRARPKMELLIELSEKYQVSLDHLIRTPLSDDKTKSDLRGDGLRVLSITVDKEGKENIELVPVKAQAGYLNGYADPQFISELPHFRLPFLPLGTYRAFEIKGDSMLPLLPGSVIVASYTDDWTTIRDGKTYIIVSNDNGVVYKRVFNRLKDQQELICQSDNPSYPPYTLNAREIVEVWEAKLKISPISANEKMPAGHMMNLMQAAAGDPKKE
jgi:transcriptional regulator with XRE-family HTH domain